MKYEKKILTEKGPKFKNLSDLVHLFGLLQNKKLYLNTHHVKNKTLVQETNLFISKIVSQLADRCLSYR